MSNVFSYKTNLRHLRVEEEKKKKKKERIIVASFERVGPIPTSYFR